MLKNKIKKLIFTARIRNKVKNIESLSFKYIKPFAPWIHFFVFITLKRYFKQQLIKRVMRPENRINSMEHISIDLTELLACDEKKEKNTPLISIIVPNYNHEPYLRKRLESIYGQSYNNFEVILLDDKSQDDSIDILNEFVNTYPDKTQLIVNTINSGGVFHQWKRGIELAKGALIWIAESDDFCSLDFLEKLVPFFNNDAVMLAYCKTIFMQDEKEIWSIQEYLSDINPNLWNEKFISSAHILVNNAWGIKNILPNASSAIFRNPKGISLLDDPKWREMRICGDWVFYLHIIRGGLVGYTPETTNYYRLHKSNTSVATYTKNIYYKEHQDVASTLCGLYNIKSELLEKQRKSLKIHWDTYMEGKSEDDFLALYNLTTLDKLKEKRKPNIMMVAFALAAGGGETLPIKMANMLSNVGYSVTMVSLEQDYENPGIRSMLSPSIALLRISCLEYIEAIATSLGIEITHSHHAWVDLTLVSLLEYNSFIKMVISTHGMYEMMTPSEFRANFSMLKSRVSKIVYTAEKNLAPFLEVTPKENLLVKIGNALEPSIVRPVERYTLGIDDDAFVLCLVSRAIPEKGWEEAIESIKKARDISKLDIHLVLIGEGSEYTRLQSLTFESYIHFLGFKENIRDFFAMSDLGFLPSRFEGESFPLVIIDCLYANRPLLASNIGEIASMLIETENAAGVLFDLENMKIPIDTVATLIAKFAMDKEFYNRYYSGISQIVLKYDPKVMIEKYDQVYTEILQKGVL